MWLLNYHIMSDDPKRKRLPGNSTSSSCSDLSLKRTKLQESNNTEFSDNSLNPKFSNEIEDLQMKVASLQFENENLAERVKILEGAKAKNNSTIAKEAHIRSVSNDQYARRANMIIYGLNETEKENTNKLVANTIKKVNQTRNQRVRSWNHSQIWTQRSWEDTTNGSKISIQRSKMGGDEGP